MTSASGKSNVEGGSDIVVVGNRRGLEGLGAHITVDTTNYMLGIPWGYLWLVPH